MLMFIEYNIMICSKFHCVKSQFRYLVMIYNKLMFAVVCVSAMTFPACSSSARRSFTSSMRSSKSSAHSLILRFLTHVPFKAFSVIATSVFVNLVTYLIIAL